MLFIYQTRTQTAFDVGKSPYVSHLVIIVLTKPLRFILKSLCFKRLILLHDRALIVPFLFITSKLAHEQIILLLQALHARTQYSLAFK